MRGGIKKKRKKGGKKGITKEKSAEEKDNRGRNMGCGKHS